MYHNDQQSSQQNYYQSQQIRRDSFSNPSINDPLLERSLSQGFSLSQAQSQIGHFPNQPLELNNLPADHFYTGTEYNYGHPIRLNHQSPVEQFPGRTRGYTSSTRAAIHPASGIIYSGPLGIVNSAYSGPPEPVNARNPPKEPITAGATGTIAGEPASSSNLASSDSSRPISDGIPSQSFGSLGRTISTTSGQPEALIESNSARAIDTRPASTSQRPDSSDSIRPVPPSSTQAREKIALPINIKTSLNSPVNLARLNQLLYEILKMR
ncbi:hypothetical protein PtA15_2A789 [Puccinia triticina]|uniref:Uncharacterized protein n=1 Tax=Puccinia triticina TaxID=208348 RepID=A0ABY7CEW4_9BASI|nr:uncharacterized protein PtA15_2A789 [Puccinia triticina]WAQ82472.1 hypothetical protein PtA15_2A789 [Puccinia triticina]